MENITTEWTKFALALLAAIAVVHQSNKWGMVLTVTYL